LAQILQGYREYFEGLPPKKGTISDYTLPEVLKEDGQLLDIVKWGIT